MESTNKSELIGVVNGQAVFSHEFLKEKYYRVTIDTERESGVVDSIPVIFSERIIKPEDIKDGDYAVVKGRFSSKNLHRNGESRLDLFVFANSFEKTDVLIKGASCTNFVEIESFVCKHPVFRETPLGRHITDIVVAVNRSFHNSDYIPCIFWGKNAYFTKDMPIGYEMHITGRIQSRKYIKKYEDGTSEEKTAIELSVVSVEHKESED